MSNTSGSWHSAFFVYTRPRVAAMIFLGFSAGLPFSLISTTLSAWLADEHVDLSVIGYFSLVGVAYSVKVLWAPVVDRLPLPLLDSWLGRRRSWMLSAQLGIAVGLWAISGADVVGHLADVALLAVLVAFCSATQDIAIDAYRIEAAAVRFQGAMAAMYVFGYRLSLLAAGAGVFYIAEFASWRLAYQVMAASMLLGIITTLLVKEPSHKQAAEERQLEASLESALGIADLSSPLKRLTGWLSDAVLSPFVEFFQRNGRTGLLILLLIAVYKMSDIAMGVMANPFYLELGFSKKDIADVSKIFGFFMTILGTSLGGVLVMKFGIMRPLLLGAVIVAATNLLFAALAVVEPDTRLLAGVISADNLSGGIASAAFIAYLSSLTNTAYTATQYALFSSLMTLPAKLIGSISGEVVAQFGYHAFFVYSAVIGLPGVVLVLVLMRLPTASPDK
ncbi:MULTISPECIES: AmpG family muropeptide MFS transporter [Methylomonas]|uniref:AmpG family muropeptide MFS transporter n=1 Tax=Methylomonas koyamae TaxID=702114 RepID=A0A177NHY8_9GAMM|nr:MFS transporter [Methylomonas koyamae]OAI17726.1 AmpG family muropeptide MFS transporter [Methylomonas koyamae]